MGLDVFFRYVGDFSVYQDYLNKREQMLDEVYAGPDAETENKMKEWDAANPEPKLARIKEFKGKFAYLRSAYNEYGLNTQLKAKIGKDLYYIFEPIKGEYYVRPDWVASLARAKEVLVLLEEHFAKYGSTAVTTVAIDTNGITRTADKGEAVKTFMRSADNKFIKYNHSSHEGDFFIAEPVKLLAAIPGMVSWFNPPAKCVYLIHEDKYQTPYEIASIKKAIKMCEVALASKNPAGYFLAWSA
jgi:hypothetical protein